MGLIRTSCLELRCSLETHDYKFKTIIIVLVLFMNVSSSTSSTRSPARSPSAGLRSCAPPPRQLLPLIGAFSPLCHLRPIFREGDRARPT